jgi:hypothetical protein
MPQQPETPMPENLAEQTTAQATEPALQKIYWEFWRLQRKKGSKSPANWEVFVEP